MSDQEIRFRIVVEDAGVAPAAQRTEQGFKRVGAAADGASRQTTAAMRMLPAQLSDVATQLAGGQNPFLVLTQQGLQTRDMFGSFSAAGRGILSLLTPMNLALGGTAAALSVVAYGAYSTYEATSKLVKGIELTGGAAGRTAGQVDLMARALASATGAGIGTARDAMDSLATSGAFAGTNMDVAGRAVVGLQRLTGQAAADIVNKLAGMRDGVTAWSIAANRAWNYLTPAQVESIRNFESQGRTQDAMRVSLEALAKAIEGRVVPAMSELDKAFERGRAARSGFWDWLFPPDTLEQQLKAIRNRIEVAQAGPDKWQVRALRQQEEAIKKQLQVDSEGAERRAKTAEDNARKILETSRSYGDAQLGVTSAFEAKQLAEQQRNIQARRLAADLDWQHRAITAKEYTDILISTELARSDAEIAAARRVIDIEKGRVVEKPEDRLARSRAVLAAQAALATKEAERDKLKARIEAGEFWVGDQAVGGESLATLVRQSERAASAAADQALSERRRSAMEASVELARTNTELNAELIKDDRSRALAQLDIEAKKLRTQLDIDGAYAREREARARMEGSSVGALIKGELQGGDLVKPEGEELAQLVAQAEEAAALRRQVDEQYATWRVLRERQVTEQLKPQWQRNLELWDDSLRDMRQRYDSFLDGFINSGRDAFVQWFKDGRISTSGLVDFIRGEFARLTYERYLAGYVKQAGDVLFGSLFGGSSVLSAAAGVITGGGGLKVPGRATGGDVRAGRLYEVNEDSGPGELLRTRSGRTYLMPRQDGTVLPASAGGSVGGGGTIIQNFTFNGRTDNRTELLAWGAQIKAETLAAVEARRARSLTGYA